jgi:hypothetical protein
MKQSIFFLAFFAFMFCGWISAANPIVITKDPPPPPLPNSFTQELPVSATISETQLSVYFESSVGDATITVYDANDNVVSQETLDTYSTTEIIIATDTWASGNYTIKITYGTTALSGIFLVE